MEFLELLRPDLEKAHHLEFLLHFAVVIVSVVLAGHLSRKIGQPSVFGQLLVGVVLGPAMLGWFDQDTPLLKELGEVGVILLMFLAGLETDVQELKKGALGATWVAIAGVVLPFLGGWAVADSFGHATSTAVFVGTLLVATSVSISVQTLRELRRLRSKEGITILGAAVIDDVLGIMVLSLVLGMAVPGSAGGAMGVVALLLKILFFFGAAAAIGIYVLPHAMRWFGRMDITATRLAFGIVVALAFAYTAEAFGMAGIVGAYLAGLTIAMSTPPERQLVHDLEQAAFAFLVPFFFVGVGIRADVTGLTAGAIGLTAVLVLVAIATKVLGCGAGALLAGFNTRQAFSIGAGMVARGEVGLIVASIGLDRGLIDTGLFTAMVVVVLVTTLVTPPMLTFSFRWNRPHSTESELSS